MSPSRSNLGSATTEVSENADIQFIPHTFLTCREIEMTKRYHVEWVDVHNIKPSPENDEIYGGVNFDSDPAMRALIDSICSMGLEEPLILTLDGFILSGHRRYFAVCFLAWKYVPVRLANIRRDQTQDYHRLLAAYNPQRIKSVAAVLSEKFIQSESYTTEADLLEREYDRSSIEHLDFMAVKGDKDVEPIGRRTEFLKAAVAVVGNMQKFWPLTIRQIHYKLLNNPPLTQTTRKANERWRYKNDVASYNKLSDLLVSARYLGHIPMHAIDDISRTSKDFSDIGFASVTQFINFEVDDFLDRYSRNRMEGQPKHIEILLEKNTLLNIIHPVCEKFMVSYSVNRGYGNPSLWRKMESRWRKGGCKPFVLLSFSDHDPEGFDLCDDAVRSLRFRHGVDVELIRVGVTQEQVDEHNVSPNFAKESSSRFQSYVDRTGSTDSWECEALDPEFIQNTIEDALLNPDVIDIEQMNAVIRRENEEKMQISKIRQRLGTQLVSMLSGEAGQ